MLYNCHQFCSSAISVSVKVVISLSYSKLLRIRWLFENLTCNTNNTRKEKYRNGIDKRYQRSEDKYARKRSDESWKLAIHEPVYLLTATKFIKEVEIVMLGRSRVEKLPEEEEMNKKNTSHWWSSILVNRYNSNY